MAGLTTAWKKRGGLRPRVTRVYVSRCRTESLRQEGRSGREVGPELGGNPAGGGDLTLEKRRDYTPGTPDCGRRRE
jgi:hypothetical protein